MSTLGRPLLAVITAGLLLPLAVGTSHAAAPGKVKVGVDRKEAVSFSIDGRTIDITLRPVGDKANQLVADLSGAYVVVACKGTSPKHGRRAVGDLQTTWPVGQSAMRGRLSHDVSDAMQWCVLEHLDGTDIAVTRKLRTPKPAAASTPQPTTPTPTPSVG